MLQTWPLCLEGLFVEVKMWGMWAYQLFIRKHAGLHPLAQWVVTRAQTHHWSSKWNLTLPHNGLRKLTPRERCPASLNKSKMRIKQYFVFPCPSLTQSLLHRLANSVQALTANQWYLACDIIYDMISFPPSSFIN